MHEAMMAGRTEPVELTLSIELTSGDWLNVQTLFHRPGPQWSPRDILPFFSWRWRSPWWPGLRRDGSSGQCELWRQARTGWVGGLTLSHPVIGPTEVRDTTDAFNRMQARLTRLVADRTDMLAALSHDLRSPLTAMRLRLELLDESEDGARLKALVDEMQEMVETTMEFARGSPGRSRPSRSISPNCSQIWSRTRVRARKEPSLRRPGPSSRRSAPPRSNAPCAT